MPVCLIFREGDSYLVTCMRMKREVKPSDAGVRSGAPGRTEPIRCGGRGAVQRLQSNGEVGARSVVLSSCPCERLHVQCPLRHLVDCHPERVALLYREKLLSDEEAEAWGLRPCEEGEESPFATEREKVCFDFANTGVCRRNREGIVCRFRHCRQRCGGDGASGNGNGNGKGKGSVCTEREGERAETTQSGGNSQ